MTDAFANPLTQRIAAFLRDIGLEVRAATIEGETALPGIDIENGVLIIDEARLAHPGDLLHEAGHLAVVPSERRARFHHDVGNDGGEELGAIAWSYAAAVHLGIEPAAVFHEAGYRGASKAYQENFAQGRFIGVPWLAYCGLSVEGRNAVSEGVKPYPHMRRWLHA